MRGGGGGAKIKYALRKLRRFPHTHILFPFSQVRCKNPDFLFRGMGVWGGAPRPSVGPSVRRSVGVAVATGKHPQPGRFGEEQAGKASLPPLLPRRLSFNIRKLEPQP